MIALYERPSPYNRIKIINDCNILKAFNDFLVEFWSKISESFGLCINSFLGGLFNGMGIFSYLKLIIVLMILSFFLKFFYMILCFFDIVKK